MKTVISKERRFKRIVTQGGQFDAHTQNDSILKNKQAGRKKNSVSYNKLHLGHFLAGPHGIFNPLLLK